MLSRKYMGFRKFWRCNKKTWRCKNKLPFLFWI